MLDLSPRRLVELKNVLSELVNWLKLKLRKLKIYLLEIVPNELSKSDAYFFSPLRSSLLFLIFLMWTVILRRNLPHIPFSTRLINVRGTHCLHRLKSGFMVASRQFLFNSNCKLFVPNKPHGMKVYARHCKVSADVRKWRKRSFTVISPSVIFSSFQFYCIFSLIVAPFSLRLCASVPLPPIKQRKIQ